MRSASSTAKKVFNVKSAGFWKLLAHCEGAFRCVNNTLACMGPKLLIFRQQPPPDSQLAWKNWTPVPDEWVHDGMVTLHIVNGTLCPVYERRGADAQGKSQAKRQRAVGVEPVWMQPQHLSNAGVYPNGPLQHAPLKHDVSDGPLDGAAKVVPALAANATLNGSWQDPWRRIGGGGAMAASASRGVAAACPVAMGVAAGGSCGDAWPSQAPMLVGLEARQHALQHAMQHPHDPAVAAGHSTLGRYPTQSTMSAQQLSTPRPQLMSQPLPSAQSQPALSELYADVCSVLGRMCDSSQDAGLRQHIAQQLESARLGLAFSLQIEAGGSCASFPPPVAALQHMMGRTPSLPPPPMMPHPQQVGMLPPSVPVQYAMPSPPVPQPAHSMPPAAPACPPPFAVSPVASPYPAMPLPANVPLQPGIPLPAGMQAEPALPLPLR